jgi:F-type H+-transporting ATPase subunit delta
VKTSGSKRIAERYVKALFDVASAGAAIDQVERDLQALAQTLEASPEFRHFLVNPLLAHHTRAEVMLAILGKLQVQQITRQFIGMLIRQKRLALLPEMIEQFSSLASAARGELKAQIITAAPLKQQEVTLVGDRLGKAYGRKMKLEVKQDPSLLGGVVVKIGSQQLDSSLAGKMRRLKNALQAA